ncbi:hypothetical protein [Sphaerotilus mobilis]|uniref:Uncharacterized protein n=1 Tax=Sphaerotilus mobilis TaxID=47994 RepID=A0A4Q7LFN9_9BURK|nr:hypothetical protein [Sphaerotilus mobilis]RZS52984.1 hypothetical protein EV685_2606 [Sphaerotilus mobilis]
MTATAERLAVIGPDPAACKRLVQALIDAKADEHGVLDASPLAQAVLEGHAPDWPADMFLVLIGPSDARPDPATTQLRLALFSARAAHAVVSGPLPQQLTAARSAWQTRQAAQERDRDPTTPRGPVWRHACGRCGDGGCEARVFEGVRRPS